MEKSRFRNIITILDNAMPEVFLDKVMKGTRYLSIYVEEKYQIKTLLKPFLYKDSSLWNRKKGKYLEHLICYLMKMFCTLL